MGGCGFFSWVGGGGEEDSSGQVLQSRFHRRRAGSNSPIFLCYILYIEQWWFSLQHVKDHRERRPILDDLGSMRCSSWDSSTTLFHTLKTVKGLLHVVPSRTPRSSGYGVLCTSVYVTCYFCYMFSLGPSSGSTGSVRISDI